MKTYDMVPIVSLIQTSSDLAQVLCSIAATAGWTNTVSVHILHIRDRTFEPE